jgi:hypothetical protein
MPYVTGPNDLSKIKTKIAFNLTKQQLICFGIGAAIGTPTYLLIRGAMWSEKKGAAYDAAVILDDTGGKYINFKLEFPKRKVGTNGR